MSTRSERIGEIITAIVMFVFALGWMDIGFGPEYTWWNVIRILGS
jgi:hypothetical protein